MQRRRAARVCFGDGADQLPRRQATQETTVMREGTAGQQDPAFRWDLTPVYDDRAAWDVALASIREAVDRIAGWKGRLAEGPAALRGCLDEYYATLKELYRASSYASMRHHEDTRDAETAAMEQQVSLVATRLSEAASFIDPEILAVGREAVEEWLSMEPGLLVYGHVLDDTLRRAEHTGSPDEEAVIASAGLVTDGPYATYGMLANADAPWPTVRLSGGEEIVLDQAAFAKHRGGPEREDRQAVFESFWSVWASYARTFGMLLYTQVKRDLFYARVRSYENSLESALDGDRIPQSVYRELVAQSNAHLPLLHRYFRLRRRMLGLAELRYYDIYPPLVRADLAFSIEEAQNLVLEAVRPLGPEVLRMTERAFRERWVDVYPRPGKRSGAYMNGHVYDVHPYVLMNFNGDYESVSTLAHEWGHAIHSFLANQAQAFVNADYSIFVAEVASTLLEALLLEHVLAGARDDTERLFYLGHALEQLRGTFFRQTMFAEFELAIHEAVEGGQALTGARLSEMYGAILRRYHGQDEGVVAIDDAFVVEWAYIPHFYYNFYVYQYATSVAASALLAERILADGPKAAEAVLGLLRSGGNGYAYDLLRAAGVDLATPAPYEALMRRMAGIMDRIEGLL